MNLTIERAALFKAVQQLSNTINERSTLPILSHLLLNTTKGTLTCAATDLDMGMTVQLSANVQEEGGIAIPARRLIEIIKELPEGAVHLQVRKNQSLLIECPQCLFRLVGLPAEEFPQLPPFPEMGALQCDQQMFKSMLALTNFAMSNEEARYVLNGTLLNLQQNLLTVVATDGRRLAMARTTLPTTPHQEFKAIIPSKAVRELLRALEAGPLDVTLLAGNQILLRIGAVTLISRLVEGEFPNYEKVIPPPSKDKVLVQRSELQAAVRRASLLATPNSQAVRFEVSAGKLIIFKEAPDIGEVREELAIQYSGKPLTAHFNPHYLLDVLKALPDEELAWELAAPDKPGVIRTSDYLYIVLPMQPT